ncbi:MAG: hypothetical protein BJ554DRAFT_7376 [Olpidium bornovanus]|uniref:OBG-type G domain-containing protein n=1 Tax=Olpidium bornovanus TaxID=278681 RepID=A0A8H7ZWR1_9FUNG|nr:MAG: hypothetical protein BJ554DRAFT_7376 [Olpidium bornovanus]
MLGSVARDPLPERPTPRENRAVLSRARCAVVSFLRTLPARPTRHSRRMRTLLPPRRPLQAAVSTAPWLARAPAFLFGLPGSPVLPPRQALAGGRSRAPSRSTEPACSAGRPSSARTTRTREARFFSCTAPAGAKPRKGDAAGAPKKLLGRPSNNLKIGVVGMPNVGKSTIFNVVTSSKADAENYPFCT